ncbi:MAG: hypothetical protein AB7O62_12445 [Pirellulales bacterium]
MTASASLTIRSLVMIASTIAIPGVAVMSYSSPPPATVKTGPKPAPSARSRAPFASRMADQAGSATDFASDSSQDFIAARTIDAAPVSLRHTDLEVRPVPAIKPLQAPAFWRDETVALPARPATLSDHEETIAAPPVAAVQNPPIRHVDRDEHRLQPTGRRMNEPERQQPPPLAIEIPTAEAGGRPAAMSNEEFSVLEDRLRELGATHYRLETWGTQGELFRFRAMMAVSAQSNHNRYFEATDRQPLRAVERVVEQVERWRAGQASTR